MVQRPKAHKLSNTSDVNSEKKIWVPSQSKLGQSDSTGIQDHLFIYLPICHAEFHACFWKNTYVVVSYFNFVFYDLPAPLSWPEKACFYP